MTHFGRTHFGRLMRALIGALVGGLLASPTVAHAQQRPVQPKTIPESVNFIWKDLEQDFSSLAEAMPEDKWTFKPTQGEFNGVRTFGEQVKHVACANQAWAKQIVGGKPGPCAEARYCPPVGCCPTPYFRLRLWYHREFGSSSEMMQRRFLCQRKAAASGGFWPGWG